ncbi:MAG: hypothetical protein K9N06_00840 [Candidatus Cloacimonetes bacterium]|nr:hypothetical protein [Candidatus Cloacimonadota bacterium]
MIVAVTEWKGRISPVFDEAMLARLYETCEGEAYLIKEIELKTMFFGSRVSQLLEEKVETLICGAISANIEHQAQLGGINVISFVSGNIEEIIKIYARGEWNKSEFAMPGCRTKEDEKK